MLSGVAVHELMAFETDRERGGLSITVPCASGSYQVTTSKLSVWSTMAGTGSTSENSVAVWNAQVLVLVEPLWQHCGRLEVGIP